MASKFFSSVSSPTSLSKYNVEISEKSFNESMRKFPSSLFPNDAKTGKISSTISAILSSKIGGCCAIASMMENTSDTIFSASSLVLFPDRFISPVSTLLIS